MMLRDLRLIVPALIVLCALSVPAAAQDSSGEKKQPETITSPWATTTKIIDDVFKSPARSKPTPKRQPKIVKQPAPAEVVSPPKATALPAAPTGATPDPLNTVPEAAQPDGSRASPTLPADQAVIKPPAPPIQAGPGDEIIKAHASKMAFWKGQLDATAKVLDNASTSDEKLRAIPGDLDKIRAELAKFGNELKPRLEDTNARLSRLGPAPKKDEPAETDTVAAQRKSLDGELAAYDGLIKQAGVLFVRAGQQTELSNKLRRERFSKRLTQPVSLYYSSFFWSKALESVPEQSVELWSVVVRTLSSTFEGGKNGKGLLVLAVPFALFAAWWIPMRTLSGVVTFQPTSAEPPSSAARAYLAIARSIFSLVPWLAAVLGLYIAAHVFGFVTAATQHFTIFSVVVLASAGLFVSVIRKSVGIQERDWRVFGREINSTGLLIGIASTLAGLWAIDQILTQADVLNNTPYPFTVLRGVIVSSAYATLLFLLLFIPLRQHGSEEELRFRGWPGPLFLLIATLVATISIATMMGYVSLARFVGGQVITTGSILYIMFLVHMAGEYISASGTTAKSGDAENLSALRVVAGLVLDILILLVGIPALLLQFGFDWTEVQGWIRTAFFGFTIGSVTVSVQAILIALGILFVGVLLTRIVQRSFVRRAGLAGRLDNGIRDSVRTGLGYLGFFASAMTAASFLGLNSSSLAIVAGGLSLGLGFGMQSIFNNFVSGLILLVERPIKMGDWISAGGNEGRVRKINVRATEIETIDKQTVIVPNAELISASVKNWTYSDRMARVMINIGVSYSSDAEQVRELLLGVAHAHPEILSMPAPSVIFMSFGESSLDFEVRTYIGDADRRIHVASDLRFNILSTLRAHNIEIPFPQRDLNIRHVDGRALEADETNVENGITGHLARTA